MKVCRYIQRVKRREDSGIIKLFLARETGWWHIRLNINQEKLLSGKCILKKGFDKTVKNHQRFQVAGVLEISNYNSY